MTDSARRLLVVDDDADIVRLVTVAMKSRGYVVTGATSLTDAMTAISATTFDIVLTDKNLKASTGLELIDALTTHAPTTAVVLMTAYPDGALGKLSALDGYVSKPFRSLELLAQALHDAIDHRKRALERKRLMSQLGEVKTVLAPASQTVRR